MESGRVRYVQREDSIWRLPVAIEAATNKGGTTTQIKHLLLFLFTILFVDEYEAWVVKKAELRAAKERMSAYLMM